MLNMCHIMSTYALIMKSTTTNGLKAFCLVFFSCIFECSHSLSETRFLFLFNETQKPEWSSDGLFKK